jgi:hypothetical protein
MEKKLHHYRVVEHSEKRDQKTKTHQNNLVETVRNLLIKI